MKIRIIDILNKMADGTLEDGFKFEYRNNIYTYSKKYEILNSEDDCEFGEDNITEQTLTEEVEVIEDVKEIAPLYYNRAKDGTYNLNTKAGVYSLGCIELTMLEKINELVQAVNQLRKESINDN